MGNQDLPEVLEIERASFKFPKSESVFREETHKYLVAKVEGKVVGYIGVEKVLDEVHIINMAVHPSWRGQGIGKKLLQCVLNDKDRFYLEVRVSNEAARRLYERFGFQVVGTRKNYYPDGEDAYIMLFKK